MTNRRRPRGVRTHPRHAAALALACAACSPALIDRSTDTGTDKETTEIYRAFVVGFRPGHDPLNVAQDAVPPRPDDIKHFSACVGDQDGPVRWELATGTDRVRRVPADLPDVRLVDPENWQFHDPDTAFRQGQPIAAAVAEGFNHGLMTLSTVAFNPAHDTAAFSYSFHCGQLCGNGGVVIARRTPQGWVQDASGCFGWIA